MRAALRTGRVTYCLYLADLSHRRTRSHGIVNYALGLARALPQALTAGERLVIIANADLEPELPAAGTEGVALSLVEWPESLPARLWSDHVTSLRAATRVRADVVHYPKGFVPIANPTRPRTVATIHDDIPLQYHQGAWGSPPDRSPSARYFAWNLRHALRNADAVTTVSDFSRRQLRRVVDRDDLSVTGQGLSLPTIPIVGVAERRRALLHFVSPLPHKRSAEAIAFALRWMEDHGDFELRLLGTPPPTAHEALRHERVVLVGPAATNDMVAAELAQARALLFSSGYEGFGLPPVEALACGTPVVYADTAVSREVLGDEPGAYPCGDYSGFARALEAALSLDDDQLRKSRARIRRRHDWAVVASRVVEVYRRML